MTIFVMFILSYHTIYPPLLFDFYHSRYLQFGTLYALYTVHVSHGFIETMTADKGKTGEIR